MRDLGSLGGTSGCSAALNDNGQVVGGMNLVGDQAQHAFRWARGHLIDLGILGGAKSHANWENAAGDVVGNADLPGSTTHGAFLWKNWHAARSGPAERRCVQHCHRDQRARSSGGGSQATCGDGGHGISWDNGRVANLNDLVAPVGGWQTQVQFAFSINDQGVIFGVGVLDNGDARGRVGAE